MESPGPATHTLGLLLLVVAVATGGHGTPRDTLACSQGLACRLLDADVLCGTEPAGPGPGLALVWLRLEPALRCVGPAACSPCLQARLRLAVEPGAPRDGDNAGDVSPSTTASPPHNVSGLLLLSSHSYASSRCVAVEVWAPLTSVPPGRRRLGSVRFRCFEAPLGSELHVTAHTNARGRRWLSQKQRVPDCSWPDAQVAVPQCQSRCRRLRAGCWGRGGVPNTPTRPCHPRGCCGEVLGCPAWGTLSLPRAVPRLQVSLGPEAVLVEVQAAAVGLNYTLRLYHNHSHGAGGSGRTVMASGPMNYSLPLEEVLPCLCLQVWLEIQDPLRATLCPFSHDAAAWERLWAQTRLVLHDTGQALACSISAPCDLPAELVPCWSPAPGAPCQALPDLQQPVTGQGPQEFRALQLHPNLCVQVRSGGQVRRMQCLQDRALPGHGDDLLLMAPGGNASLCALERGGCTPLASFTATGSGRPGLLEQQLQEDVASGQCLQLWRPDNSSGVALWACPMHKYLRTRWALAWMGLLLGAACILLLLLLKKEDLKGWLKSLRAGYRQRSPSAGTPHAPAARSRAGGRARRLLPWQAALRPLGMTVVAAPGGWHRGGGVGHPALAARAAPPGAACRGHHPHPPLPGGRGGGTALGHGGRGRAGVTGGWKHPRPPARPRPCGVPVRRLRGRAVLRRAGAGGGRRALRGGAAGGHGGGRAPGAAGGPGFRFAQPGRPLAAGPGGASKPGAEAPGGGAAAAASGGAGGIKARGGQEKKRAAGPLKRAKSGRSGLAERGGRGRDARGDWWREGGAESARAAHAEGRGWRDGAAAGAAGRWWGGGRGGGAAGGGAARGGPAGGCGHRAPSGAAPGTARGRALRGLQGPRRELQQGAGADGARGLRGGQHGLGGGEAGQVQAQ
uniref:Interleukin-17 receptor C/E N-terminal domain-containing protein n=1 Tax=Anas platyrhynchos TaxID=8839 RepID=A0A8B9TGC0_ANAPL